MTFERLNPMTGEVASTARAMTVAEAAAVAERADAAFPAWSATGPSARRALLTKAADALQAKAPAFVAAMMAETGSTQGWAMFNVSLAADVIREAAALTTQIGGEVIPSDRPGCLAMALREPVGVMLGIAPWNGPVVLGVRALAVPLACGNTVILKASETCPRTHQLIVEAFEEAGFPDGVVNIVTNAPADAEEVVGALIDHPAVRRINFTGSTAVGRVVAQRAAAHLKPVLLELGGKAPFVGSRRRRSGRSGEGRGVRGVHEPGPDLHVDGADYCGGRGGRCLRRKVPGEGGFDGSRRSARREDSAGRGGGSSIRGACRFPG